MIDEIRERFCPECGIGDYRPDRPCGNCGHKSRDEEVQRLEADLDENIERTKNAESNAKIWQDENKRLEAENKELTDTQSRMSENAIKDLHELAELKAENKKLRDTIQKIQELSNGGITGRYHRNLCRMITEYCEQALKEYTDG